MMRCRWVIVLACVWLAAAAPSLAQTPRSVLILSSEATEMPAVAGIVDDTVAAVHAAASPVSVFIESMERTRFPGEGESQLALYRRRYAQRRLDLVVTICAPALEFALRHRDEIFPGVPILYSFVEPAMVPALPPGANVSGVYLRPRWDALITLGLALHPRTGRVIVIGGSSEFDHGWMASFDRAVRTVQPRAAIVHVADVPLRDMLGAVAMVPDDAIILFTTVSRDAAGDLSMPRDVLRQIRRVSKAPVYGIASTFLGFGIVGGELMDLRAHGVAVGKLAARVLTGESLGSIPPSASPNVLAFDDRELRRLGIRESRLPRGAAVMFREPKFWSIDPVWIVAAVVLFGAQTALIVGLVAQRRKRAILEGRLKAQLRFETLLSDVSAALGSVTVPRIETALTKSLSTIRQYLAVDRVSVFEFTPDGRARRTFEDAVPSTVDVPSDYPLSQLPAIALTIASLQPFVMGKLDDLPADAEHEREAVKLHEIRSMLVVPLAAGGQALGALSCASHTREMDWPADRIQQVTTLGQTLANALQRRITDLAVAESDRLRGAVLSSMSAQIAVLDRAGIIIAVNDAWLAFGRANGVRNEMSISPGASYVAVCERGASEGAPGAADALEGVKAVCEGRSDIYDGEYRLEGPEGERWFAMKVVPLRHAAGGAVVTHRDVTVEKRQEMAVRRSEQRFRLLADAQRVLSGRLITAQEDERRRIARELHDDLQQRLALLAIELDVIANTRQALTSDEAVACARRLWQKTVEISSEVHALSHRLHPSKLEALGLLKTVRGYCRELSQHGLRVAFTDEGVPDSIPPDVALSVFRVVQESLQNVVKHSGAADARVTMAGRDGRLRLTVEDDGRGFDTTVTNHGAGLGLVSMRERLHLVGGELTIESACGRGTKVAFDVPCPDEQAAPAGNAAPESEGV
jgi:signal transduction histidine kinase